MPLFYKVHESVLNHQELPANQELTGTDKKCNLGPYLCYYFLFWRIKIRSGCTIYYNNKMNKNGYFEEFELAKFDQNSQSYQGGNFGL